MCKKCIYCNYLCMDFINVLLIPEMLFSRTHWGDLPVARSQHSAFALKEAVYRCVSVIVRQQTECVERVFIRRPSGTDQTCTVWSSLPRYRGNTVPELSIYSFIITAFKNNSKRWRNWETHHLPVLSVETLWTCDRR